MSYTHYDCTIAWVSALPCEFAAARALLDVKHDDLSTAEGDPNFYTLGSMGSHNIVITTLPQGTAGIASAATVATSLLRSFPNIRFGLMVGVGGGVPCDGEIRLGDVVVSCPEGQFGKIHCRVYCSAKRLGGVIKYAFGADIQGSGFQIRGSLNKPPHILMNAVVGLRGQADNEGYRLGEFVEEAMTKYPNMRSHYERPKDDLLFEQDYMHTSDTKNCLECSKNRLVVRSERSAKEQIQIHYGLIGSADRVMRDAKLRDQLYHDLNIKCLEMEAAGLMDNFPCIVIRGICGAYAKELLSVIPPRQIKISPYAQDVLESVKQLPGLMMEINQTIKNTLQDKDNECLRDLRLTDPAMDKERIEADKGGLLNEAYIWIKDNATFESWYRSDCKLLWITGTPGKGKTMLLCGMMNELKKTPLVYFFFQVNDKRLNSGVAALRGLMFMLIRQHPSLIRYLRYEYDQAGRSFFEDANSWFALSVIFKKMLEDTIIHGTNIIIDALDECSNDRDKLLQLIIQLANTTRTQWIISSRPWSEIARQLVSLRGEHRLSLELNESYIATAVTRYIQYKVEHLTIQQSYDRATKDLVVKYLQNNASDTFLWVALACQHLQGIENWRVTESLNSLPPGLDGLYHRMTTLLFESDISNLLKQILAVTCIAIRPLNIHELAVLLDLPWRHTVKLNSLRDLVHRCGSFLVIHNDNIQLVHASAREYLLSYHEQTLFPRGQAETHNEMFINSIKALSLVLCHNIYNIDHPGTHVDDVSIPQPDPLQGISYACVHFLNHLSKSSLTSSNQMADGGPLHVFLINHYLHWLEAMSFLRKTIEAQMCMTELQNFLQTHSLGCTELRDTVYDAYRFIVTFAPGIEHYPLQVYCSGLLFSPARSLIKQAFSDQTWPSWLKLLSDPVEVTWSPLLRVFDGHSNSVDRVAFSPDSKILATGSSVGLIKLWNPSTGALKVVLSGHTSHIHLMNFSSDGRALISCDQAGEIRAWDVESISLIATIYTGETGHRDPSWMALFPTGDQLATLSRNGGIKVWDMMTGTCLHTWKMHSNRVYAVHVSHDGLLMAVITNKTIDLYDTKTGNFLQSLFSHKAGELVHCKIEFSDDDGYLVFSAQDQLSWCNLRTGRFMYLIGGDYRNAFEFIPSSNSIGTLDFVFGYFIMFDLEAGSQTKQISLVSNLANPKFAPYDKDLVCGTVIGQATLWDLSLASSTDSVTQSPPLIMEYLPCGTKIFCWNLRQQWICDVFNHDSAPHVVSSCGAKRSWDFHDSGRLAFIGYGPLDGECKKLSYHYHYDVVSEHRLYSNIDVLKFSICGRRLYAGMRDGVVQVIDTESKTAIMLTKFKAHKNADEARPGSEDEFAICDIAFFSNNESLATCGNFDKTVKIWNVHPSQLLKTIMLDFLPYHLAISPISSEIAISSGNHAQIYDSQSLSYTRSVGYDLDKIIPGISYLGGSERKIAYDASGHYLKSPEGIWKIDPLQPAPLEAKSSAQGYIYIRDHWIYQGSKKIIWIAPGYMRSHAVYGNNVTLAHVTNDRLMNFNINGPIERCS